MHDIVVAKDRAMLAPIPSIPDDGKPIAVVIVLDPSGSMESLRGDVVPGLKSLTSGLKKLSRDVVMSVRTFNDSSEWLVEAKPIQLINETVFDAYLPAGGTALYQTTSRAVRGMAEAFKEFDGHVLFIVFSDGMDNSSGVKYPASSVRTLVDIQTRKGWTFLFFGLGDQMLKNQGTSMGIGHSVVVPHTGEGVTNAFRSVSDTLTGRPF